MKPRHKAALIRRALHLIDRLTGRLEAQLDRCSEQPSMPYPPLRPFYLYKTTGSYTSYE